MHLVVAPAIVVSRDHRVVVVRYEDGTTARFPIAFAARAVWTTEAAAREELTSRGQRPQPRMTPSSSRADTPAMGIRVTRAADTAALFKSVPEHGRRETPPAGLDVPRQLAVPHHVAARSAQMSSLADRLRGNTPPAGTARVPNPVGNASQATRDKLLPTGVGSRTRPLSWYFDSIIGAARRLRGLDDVGVGTDEAPMEEALERLRMAFNGLHVDDAAVWGALLLYVVARSRSTHRVPRVDARALTVDQFAAVLRGASLWRREGIRGVDDLVDHMRRNANAASPSTAMLAWHVEVERLSRSGGLERIRVRAVAHEVTEGCATVALAFRVPDRDDIAVILEDAPGAKLAHDRVEIMIGDEWTEISFRLVGPRLERVRLAASVPALYEDPVEIEGDFAVGTDARRDRRSPLSSSQIPTAPVNGANAAAQVRRRSPFQIYVRPLEPVLDQYRAAVRVVSRFHVRDKLQIRLAAAPPHAALRFEANAVSFRSSMDGSRSRRTHRGPIFDLRWTAMFGAGSSSLWIPRIRTCS